MTTWAGLTVLWVFFFIPVPLFIDLTIWLTSHEMYIFHTVWLIIYSQRLILYQVYHKITNSYKIDQYFKLTALFISIFHLYIKCTWYMFVIYIIRRSKNLNIDGKYTFYHIQYVNVWWDCHGLGLRLWCLMPL